LGHRWHDSSTSNVKVKVKVMKRKDTKRSGEYETSTIKQYKSPNPSLLQLLKIEMSIWDAT